MKFSLALCAVFTLCIGVARAQLSPTFTEQPMSQHVVVGSTVTLTATVTGSEPMTYEWFKDLGRTPISTSRTLVLTNVQTTDRGAYYLRATSPGGTRDSHITRVEVVPLTSGAPRFSSGGGGGPNRVGGTIDLSNSFIGAHPMTFQWLRNGVPIPGATHSAYYKRNAQPSDRGSYTVTATNSLGSATSFPIQIDFSIAPLAPVFVDYSRTRLAKLGQPANLWVVAEGEEPITYRWEKNGVVIPGATGPELTIPNVTSADGANYSVSATNPHGTNSSGFLILQINNPPRLTNLAVRSRAGADLNQLVAGFVVGNPAGGNAPFFMVRAIGPSLAAFGVTGALADPKLTVAHSVRGILSSNDNWGGSTTISDAARSVGAFPLVSPTSKDAVVYTSFSQGPYTALVTSADDAVGVALAEIYDTTAAPTTYNPRLVNVSARTRVGIGDDILIAGFSVAGDQPLRVLIRAIGPTLGNVFSVPGALADPKLTLFRGSIQLGENDDWGGTRELAETFSAVGAFQLQPGTKDAAIVTTLPPGSYTAQVTGTNGTTGVALVEVYEVP